MERRKTEATGGNWPRIDILCKHVENVYIGGKRIAWKIEVTSGWKNNEGFLISRTPSQSCQSKKIGTFENLSKCEFRDRGLKSYQLEIERLIIYLGEWILLLWILLHFDAEIKIWKMESIGNSYIFEKNLHSVNFA